MKLNVRPASVELGQVFGKLTVINYEGFKKSGKQNYRVFRCLCECGNEFVTRGVSLKTGNTLSCGCDLKHYRELMCGLDRCKIKPGDRFGRLTAIRRVGTKRSGTGTQALIEFRCDCGRVTVKLASSVRSGKTLSCGCLRKEVCSQMGAKFGPANGGRIQVRLASGLRACRRLMHEYRHSAQERGLTFSLTFEEFLKITSMDCHYCGTAPSCVQKGPAAKQRTDYIYNGIDRTDNSKGYVLSNCVPCCKRCNVAKNNRTQAEFIAWAKCIAGRFI